MAGIIIQLLVSWIIIRLYDKGNLSVLGLRATGEHIIDFSIFFAVTAIACASGFLMKMFWGGEQWQVNPALSGSLLLNGVWWNIKSVLFEELIFRGVLLYILLKELGKRKAIMISAAGFGVYHWFSFGVIGNPTAMIITFFITGIMGLLLAFGYSKTLSLYIPLGIHLGWNITQVFIFSQGPIGEGILISKTTGGFRTDSYLIFFVVTFLPVLIALSLNYLLIAKHRQGEQNG